MARKKKAEEHGGGGGGHGGASGRWLVSYADFMTLMFVLFVVLNSFSQMSASKFNSLARSLHSAMGPVGPDIPPLPSRGLAGTIMPIAAPDRPGDLPDTPDFPLSFITPRAEDEPIREVPVPVPADAKPAESPTQTQTQTPSTPPKAPIEKTDALAELQKNLESLPISANGAVAVALQQMGLQISIATEVLFEPGKADLRPEAKQRLAQIADQLRTVEFPLEIHATADDAGTAPDESAFKLSAERTVAVYNYLVNEQGFEPTKLHGSQSTGADAGHRVTIMVLRRQ